MLWLVLLGVVLAFCWGFACCGLWAGAKVSAANARALDACTACANWRNRYQQMREAFDTLCGLLKEGKVEVTEPGRTPADAQPVAKEDDGG
jgi:hypothetical protein